MMTLSTEVCAHCRNTIPADRARLVVRVRYKLYGRRVRLTTYAYTRRYHLGCLERALAEDCSIVVQSCRLVEVWSVRAGGLLAGVD